ncbi:FkbM family methyltransferase [Oxalobacter aliiformigenes]|uniref:FkbM family methyltransferase n=1 Tax=Oxalobacter aliiformigenes TaxID=2946593 RepID=UPI0022B038B7|nr:FkbM family methyltransferase [Oxalobacter aliiformigenes]WAV88723.1 FkbM family methyltransferase [Oxalobacter aliiformigenes]
MFYIRNSRRAFEAIPIASDALNKVSDDFYNDFLAVVKYCAVNIKLQKYLRLSFNMSPEPYGIDSNSVSDLIEHAKEFCKPGGKHWQWLYSNMADIDSKLLLLTVLAYRAIGWRYVKMPLDTEAFWEAMKILSGLEAEGESFSEKITNLRKINLRQFGYDVELFSDGFGIFNEFIYSQYEFRGRWNVYTPQNGDVVLDCGACFGGTSLYFASRSGETGRVISFEFLPENLVVFKENMRLNPHLSPNITLVPRPVWTKPDIKMSIEGTGPATQVFVDDFAGKSLEETVSSSNSWHCFSTSIDQTVDNLGLEKVDYIKMDIEGAEMMALRGAESTIRKFRPTLAICVYHKLIDFYELPEFINSLDLGYRFYFSHSTVHGDESVIFAIARDIAVPVKPLYILEKEMKEEVQTTKNLLLESEKKIRNISFRDWLYNKICNR